MADPRRPDTPQILAAKRSAARTGLISVAVIIGLVLIGDIFLAISGHPITWRRRLARYQPQATPPDKSAGS